MTQSTQGESAPAPYDKSFFQIEFTDCWQQDANDPKDIPADQRWMAVADKLKIVVTAPTKQEAFEEVIKSVRVMFMYHNAMKPATPSNSAPVSEVGELEKLMKRWRVLVEESRSSYSYLLQGSRPFLNEWHKIYDNAAFLFCEELSGFAAASNGEAVEFAEWVETKGWYMSNATANGVAVFYWSNEFQSRNYTTPELYQLFLQSKTIIT